MVYVLYDKLGNWLIKLQDSIHFGIEFSDSEESPIFSFVNFKTRRNQTCPDIGNVPRNVLCRSMQSAPQKPNVKIFSIRFATLFGIPPMMQNFAFVCRNFSTRGGIPAQIYNVA